MNNRLSHSACSKYQTCPRAYKYHYIDGYRSRYISSALLFGSALDNAINAMLKDEGKTPEEVFESNWKIGKIANKNEHLEENEQLVYAASDFDKDLLLDHDFKMLEAKSGISGSDNLLELFKLLGEKKKANGFVNMTSEDRKLYNYFNWLSLRRKGFLMIDAYREKIAPFITKVHAVQEYIELNNGEGDKIVGYVDLIADWKDVGTVIFDLKTSSIEYEKDAVLTSPQLTLYTHKLKEKYNTRRAGFLVLRKGIMKDRVKVCSVCGFDGSGSRHKTCSNEINGGRCGGTWQETVRLSVDVQILIDEVPEQIEEIVLENFADINNAIHSGMFHRNLNSCVQGWGPCDFYNLCYKNSDGDLVKTK